MCVCSRLSIVPVIICTPVLPAYGCVSIHIKTLVQKLRPEGLCVIHKTLVIGNPKTSIPGKCDPPIRDYERAEAQEKKHKKKKTASRKKEGKQNKASKNKASKHKASKNKPSKKLIEQNARKQDV